jgi:phage protein D
MDFAARARSHQNLYVPAASIAVGSTNRDLLTSYGLTFTQVEVDLQLSVSGTFKFTIPDTFDREFGEFLTPSGDAVLDILKLGTRVWISMGYGDRRSQSLMMAGVVTAISTSFAEGGSPELEVSGSDGTYPMSVGTHQHQFRDKSVRDAVAKVASDYDFSLKFEGEPPSDVSLDSNLQTDLDFLRKLAGDFSTPEKKWEFFARPTSDGDQLYFRPRQTDAGSIGTLKWGVDLLSFKPEANLGEQVSKVEILGWDEIKKERILGQALRGREPGRSPEASSPVRSGGEQQQRILGRETVLQLRYPVKTQQEADNRAAAELAKRAKEYIKGEGETFGFPELLPDTNIKLEGLGLIFSTTYYVEKTVHRFDASGYRTRFSIQETTGK